MTPVASLLFVVESSKQSLDRLVTQLEATPVGYKSIPALLSAITRDCDTLSAALGKLAASNLETLPERKPDAPTNDGHELLDKARRMFAIIDGRECAHCGGATRHDA